MNLLGLQITKAPAKPKSTAPPKRGLDLGAIALYVLGGAAQLTPTDFLAAGLSSHTAHTAGIISIVAGLVLRAAANPTPPKGFASVVAPAPPPQSIAEVEAAPAPLHPSPTP